MANDRLNRLNPHLLGVVKELSTPRTFSKCSTGISQCVARVGMQKGRAKSLLWRQCLSSGLDGFQSFQRTSTMFGPIHIPLF
jgi:hypothetical protein